jgi:hypothetical protein
MKLESTKAIPAKLKKIISKVSILLKYLDNNIPLLYRQCVSEIRSEFENQPADPFY